MMVLKVFQRVWKVFRKDPNDFGDVRKCSRRYWKALKGYTMLQKFLGHPEASIIFRRLGSGSPPCQLLPFLGAKGAPPRVADLGGVLLKTCACIPPI
jgi:hypothetical protein